MSYPIYWTSFPPSSESKKHSRDAREEKKNHSDTQMARPSPQTSASQQTDGHSLAGGNIPTDVSNAPRRWSAQITHRESSAVILLSMTQAGEDNELKALASKAVDRQHKSPLDRATQVNLIGRTRRWKRIDKLLGEDKSTHSCPRHPGRLCSRSRRTRSQRAVRRETKLGDCCCMGSVTADLSPVFHVFNSLYKKHSVRLFV